MLDGRDELALKVLLNGDQAEFLDGGSSRRVYPPPENLSYPSSRDYNIPSLCVTFDAHRQWRCRCT